MLFKGKDKLIVDWSVYDKSTLVKWTHGTQNTSIQFQEPPLGISCLDKNSLVAIFGNPKEFGSNNFLLYSMAGELVGTISPPESTLDCYFCHAKEISSEKLNAILCFKENNKNIERQCAIEFPTGKRLSSYSRAY